MFEASVVLVDPPWEFKLHSAKGEKKSAQAHYQCMSIADLMALPVGDLCQPDAVCVMWCTWPFLNQGLHLLKWWGFNYKTGGSWLKQSKTGASIAFGPGYIYRSCSEPWLLGTIGKPKTVSRSIRNGILAPVREHSRKPDQMRKDLQALYPGPYVELFARQPAAGWSSWGNEKTKFEAVA